MIALKEVAIVIPAYEAAETLEQVISDWLEYGALPSQIWVVDDGSPDSTGEEARKMGVNVLRHQKNLGKGAALKSGFQGILEADYRWVITMDADRQHDVREATRFLELDPRTFDLVIGTRRYNMAGMPFDRWFVNRLTSTVLSLYGGRGFVTDSQCGYRLISAQLIRKIPLVTNHFDTESEMVAKALRAGYRIIEVPITTLYNSPHSHINKFLDTARFIGLCLFRLSWR